MTKPYTENGRDNNGRAELFTELYSGVYKELYRFALGYLGNREDAEDAVQDTAVEAFKGMEKLKDLSSFKSWIFVILVRRCKSKLSDKVRARNTVDISDVEYELEAKGDRLSEFEDVNAVMSALSSLSKSNRDVMLLSIIGDMQSDQIAQILGIPPTTVRSRITRSLKYLKKALSGATKNSLVGHLYSEYEENDSKEGRNGELPGQKQAKA